MGRITIGSILDSAEPFLRTSQAVLDVHHAKSFRKPDDEWYINE